MEKTDLQNILIVDDERDICLLVRSILKRKTAAKIDLAYSVSEGKEKLHEVNYDLVFFDVRLRDGSGIELVEEVRSNRETPPYIAMISAYTSKVDLEVMDDLNVNEFIPKPLSSEKIINCYLAASA